MRGDQEVADHTTRAVGDGITLDLFKKFLPDQEGHMDVLETQSDLNQRVGSQNHAQLNV